MRDLYIEQHCSKGSHQTCHRTIGFGLWLVVVSSLEASYRVKDGRLLYILSPASYLFLCGRIVSIASALRRQATLSDYIILNAMQCFVDTLYSIDTISLSGDIKFVALWQILICFGATKFGNDTSKVFDCVINDTACFELMNVERV